MGCHSGCSGLPLSIRSEGNGTRLQSRRALGSRMLPPHGVCAPMAQKDVKLVIANKLYERVRPGWVFGMTSISVC